MGRKLIAYFSAEGTTGRLARELAEEAGCGQAIDCHPQCQVENCRQWRDILDKRNARQWSARNTNQKRKEVYQDEGEMMCRD